MSDEIVVTLCRRLPRSSSGGCSANLFPIPFALRQLPSKSACWYPSATLVVLAKADATSFPSSSKIHSCLGDESARCGALVAPRGSNDTRGLVVASKAVNAGLDKTVDFTDVSARTQTVKTGKRNIHQAELGIAVLAVALQMLAHGNGLLDEEPKLGQQ